MEPVLRSRVQLFIKCTDLKDVKILSKPNPYVEVLQKRSSSWLLLGKTEVICDDLNPEFATCFELDYFFEVETCLNFKIFMSLDRTVKDVQDKFLGHSEYSLSEIVGYKGHWLKKNIFDAELNQTNGLIFVRADQIENDSNMRVDIVFEGHNLNHNAKCCQVFKQMFKLYRMMETEGHQIVYTSEVKRGKNPTWNKISKNVNELSSGDLNKPLIFELGYFTFFGTYKIFGKFNFTLNEIKENDRKAFRVVSENLGKGGDRRDLGEIRINSATFVPEPTFLDYIYGGCSINLVIGVDFTSSNGNPKTPNSLHYIDPLKYNQYQSALNAVGKILLAYDTDQAVPMYGFGAIVNEKINHCFAMNFDEENPNVFYIDGIMEAYKNTIQRVKLSGPTNFAPILATTVSMAEQVCITEENQQYFILLIITDGNISDMRDTIDIIVKGSFFPMSIVIIGVGDSNFNMMDILDGDGGLLKNSRGELAERDIVQFVPYSRFSDNIEELTSEVLMEIPREIKGYFMRRNILPRPKLDDHQVIEYKEKAVDLTDIKPEIN